MKCKQFKEQYKRKLSEILLSNNLYLKKKHILYYKYINIYIYVSRLLNKHKKYVLSNLIKILQYLTFKINLSIQS